MDMVNIIECIRILKKRFKAIVIFVCIAVVVTYLVASSMQTYTCSFSLQHKNEGIEEGLAPNGEKLDVYNIMSPVIVSAALNASGDADTVTVESIRNNMTISPVITSQDADVKESAAAQGEVYEVIPDEYVVQCKYDAGLESEFGGRLFNYIIKAYDEWYVSEYYDKRTVADFLGVIDYENMEYMELCDIIDTNITTLIDYFTSMSEGSPDFRSYKTGFTFSDLSDLYSNLNSIEYSKYYANVRAGLLCRDKSTLIKNYENQIKQLTSERDINKQQSELYKSEITTFYDAYKQSNLYRQAEESQANVNSSNSENNMVYDTDLEKVMNTYDDIVLNYTTTGTTASNLARQCDFYQQVIDEYKNDNVPAETKEYLLQENEKLIAQIAEKVSAYAEIANLTIAEYYDNIVANDIEYITYTSVETNLPIMLIVGIGFLMALVFGCIFAIFYESLRAKTLMLKEAVADDDAAPQQLSAADIDEDEEDMPQFESSEEELLYMQYKKGFSDCYVAYHPIMNSDGTCSRSRAHLRWNSAELGDIALKDRMSVIEKLGIKSEIYTFFVNNVAEELKAFDKAGLKKQVVAIGGSSLGFTNEDIEDIIADVIAAHSNLDKRICVVLSETDVSALAYSVSVARDLKLEVCIDDFEKLDDMRLLKSLKPDCIRIGMDSETFEDKKNDGNLAMVLKLRDIVSKCRELGIMTIVKGVGTKEQKELASVIGADCQEGTLYPETKTIGEHIADIVSYSDKFSDEPDVVEPEPEEKPD